VLSFSTLKALDASHKFLLQKGAPALVIYFFANDSLLYCEANFVEWRKLMRLLEKYENAFG
jgi:peroxiredoxin